MSKDNKEYEEAATQLVDLEDFRKYMAEEEEEEAQRVAEASEAAGTAAETPPAAAQTEYVPSQTSNSSQEGTGNAKLCAALGLGALIPGLGLLLGPAAIFLASKEKKSIEAGNSSAGGLQQVNIGMILGVVGLLISAAGLIFTQV